MNIYKADVKQVYLYSNCKCIMTDSTFFNYVTARNKSKYQIVSKNMPYYLTSKNFQGHCVCEDTRVHVTFISLIIEVKKSGNQKPLTCNHCIQDVKGKG